MSDFIDLHVHSTASDGSVTPAELVKLASEKGLYAFALTDHDTVDGIAEALQAAESMPVKVIPGVEISSVYNGREVHVLGLGIDYENEFLINMLNQIGLRRYERNSKMCELLCRHGIDISMPKLYARFNSRIITRTNFSIYMIEKGYVKTKAEAFEKYLGDKAPCYIPRFKLSLEDTFKLIDFAGGFCSLAHPVKYMMQHNEYLELFMHCKKIGINGIEAIYSENSFEDENKFKEFAKGLGMKVTGGSDFHGLLKPEINIGTGKGNLMIPKSILGDIFPDWLSK